MSLPAEKGTRCRVYWNVLLIGIVMALVVAGCGPTLKQVIVSDEAVQIEREKQEDIAFSRFIEKQNRLFSISYPMLVASGELFTDKVRPTYGFMLHDNELYGKILGKEYKKVAVRNGIGEHVTVRYVYPESPADLAGLLVGDRVLAINEQSLDDENAIDAVKILHKLDYPEDSYLELLIEREGQTKKLTINGIPACKYSVQMVNSDAVNAFAGAEGVSITTGMLRFCETDKELALVVGHEISHIALGHLTKGMINRIPGMILDAVIAATLGVHTQVFEGMSYIVFSKAFEQETDYAGLYILARAAYDVTGAADFFRRMAVEHPGSIKGNFLATHPSMPERFVAIENTIHEIEEKQRKGEPLIPEKKDNNEK
ncbi:hypothetical protein LCGC14_1531450 [marine sediment metagenome]|uniref:PDZ domain-containing protein n=1 Tax=marine sediment metagenome TaxID=412755 RepID=A0A0F9LWM6_9ZZZZ|nr:PDZ domain-containing protein [Candidatus Scalindua sp.]